MKNQNYVELLKRAKFYLAVNGSEVKSGTSSQFNRHHIESYICNALRQAYYDGVGGRGRSRSFQRLVVTIEKRIDRRYSIIEWLFEKGYITQHPRSKEDYDQIQAFRHRWVDELIKEFS